MESLSSAVLVFLGLIAFSNYKNRTLGTWLKAKFFNSAAPAPSSGIGDAASALSLGLLSGPSTPTGLGGALGRLLWPVTGKITSPFGENRGNHTHSGIDIAASTGTPVKASRAGVVTFAGADGAYGLRVDVSSGGGVSQRYAHLSRIGVSVGQEVTVGQVLGNVGATGDATGPHLHFELLRNGVATNPLPYLDGSALGAGVIA